jgi:hypothetical protein
MNLIEGTLAEINRVNEIIAIYDELPNSSGRIGAALMRADVEDAYRLIGTGDTIPLMARLKSLQEWQL